MFFVLAFGLVTLGFSVRYAVAPTWRGLRTTLGLCVSTLFTTVTSICADLAAVGHGAPQYQLRHPETPLSHVVLQGIAESLSPAVLGFTLLSLTALVLAAGLHRQNGSL